MSAHTWFQASTTKLYAVILYRHFGKIYPSHLTLKMGLLGCPETSVRYYHYTLRNISEERKSHVSTCTDVQALCVVDVRDDSCPSAGSVYYVGMESCGVRFGLVSNSWLVCKLLTNCRKPADLRYQMYNSKLAVYSWHAEHTTHTLCMPVTPQTQCLNSIQKNASWQAGSRSGYLEIPRPVGISKVPFHVYKHSAVLPRASWDLDEINFGASQQGRTGY
jgi:hypothetical protein